MKTEIKYGLITIFTGILWVLAEHFAGLNTTNFEKGEIARMIFAFLPFVFLILGVRAKKKAIGKLTYLAALRSGALISFIYSVGLSVWFWIYATYINTEFLPKAVAWENAKVLKKGLTGQPLEDAIKDNTRMFSGSAFSYLMLFLSFFVMGVIVSAIIALVVKSKKQQ